MQTHEGRLTKMFKNTRTFLTNYEPSVQDAGPNSHSVRFIKNKKLRNCNWQAKCYLLCIPLLDVLRPPF